MFFILYYIALCTGYHDTPDDALCFMFGHGPRKTNLGVSWEMLVGGCSQARNSTSMSSNAGKWWFKINNTQLQLMMALRDASAIPYCDGSQ